MFDNNNRVFVITDRTKRETLLTRSYKKAGIGLITITVIALLLSFFWRQIELNLIWEKKEEIQIATNKIAKNIQDNTALVSIVGIFIAVSAGATFLSTIMALVNLFALFMTRTLRSKTFYNVWFWAVVLASPTVLSIPFAIFDLGEYIILFLSFGIAMYVSTYIGNLLHAHKDQTKVRKIALAFFITAIVTSLILFVYQLTMRYAFKNELSLGLIYAINILGLIFSIAWMAFVHWRILRADHYFSSAVPITEEEHMIVKKMEETVGAFLEVVLLVSMVDLLYQLVRLIIISKK
ncbi:MAG: hypothetical protein E7Y34_00435 [Mycoplasma sp.]|nr:hypothetical protein [Mycoplasma sp.]